MNPNFTKLAFNNSVKKLQEQYGSRKSYARMELSGRNHADKHPSHSSDQATFGTVANRVADLFAFSGNQTGLGLLQ